MNTPEVLSTWKRFIEGQPLGTAPSRAILESWERCRAFDVETAQARLRRVPLADLQARLSRRAPLVAAARRHLEWALASMGTIQPVILILADEDGVVLDSIGNAPAAMNSFGLVPGFDWSEKAMGTNGIGTAIAFRAPVAVIGPEHYTATWHNNTCVGAPVFGPDGSLLGAVDISTTAADGDPARLVLVAFVAHVIGLELGRGRRPPFAPPDLLERASTEGSSADRRAVEQGAEALARLEPDLLALGRTGARTRTDDARLEEVIDRAAARHSDIRMQIRAPIPETTSLDPSLFERALVHLVALMRRRGAAIVEVSLDADAGSAIVEVRDGSGAKIRNAAPVDNLQRAGTALGEWLATQLLASSGATLERRDSDDLGEIYVVRVPLTRPRAGAS